MAKKKARATNVVAEMGGCPWSVGRWPPLPVVVVVTSTNPHLVLPAHISGQQAPAPGKLTIDQLKKSSLGTVGSRIETDILYWGSGGNGREEGFA